MKKISLFLILLILLSSCTPAKPKEKIQEFEYFAMDTYCNVSVYGENGSDFENISQDIATKSEMLLLYPQKENIYISQMANQILSMNSECANVVDKALEISELSNGAFNLFIAPLTKLWDITNRTQPPSFAEIENAKIASNPDKIEYNNEVKILKFLFAGAGVDIGGVGKGYAGDKTAQALKDAGYSAGIVNLGGNITVFGKKLDEKPFVIGIKNPIASKNDSTSVIGQVVCNDCSVITSGAYQRYFEYDGNIYHHILDTQTGKPSQSDLISVTVIGKDGVYADALSTAVFVLGNIEGSRLLEDCVSRGMINGAILVDNKCNVFKVGDVNFTLTNEVFHRAY